MHKNLTSAFIAGLLSAGLFLFVFGIGLGFIFMFLPTLPLFTLGLSRRAGPLPLSILIAGAIIGAAAGISATILYLLLLGLPTWYICVKSNLSRIENGEAHWLRLGNIFTLLTVFACAAIGLITMFYAFQPNNLPQLLAQNIHETFADLQDDYGEVIDMLAESGAFLIFALTIWLWGIALYFHGWLAHRALHRRSLATRPDFAITPFTIPSWMLSLLAICALASLIGGESMRFLGKSSLISLLFPYFLLGASLMHTASRKWPSAGFILFFVYFLIFSQFWPALILSGIGLFYQLKHLNKHLSDSGSSTRS